MAEKFKSVLEKYDAKGKRRLPTPEEEAITPVYPEGYLLGGAGKGAAMGLKTLTKKEPVRKFDVPEIGSKLLKPKEALERLARDKEEKIPDILERKVLDAMKNAHGDFAYNVAIPSIQEQDKINKMNAAGDTYKKGGKVSSASKRADGIAQRGKTKGRLI